MARQVSVTPAQLEEARAVLEQRGGALSDLASADLPAHLADILPEAQQIAHEKLPLAQARIDNVRGPLTKALNESVNARFSRKGRLEKIRLAGKIFNEALMPLSACSNGACNHCCHIPVAISKTEAEIIGNAVGRKPRKLPGILEFKREYGYHMPCPFLKNGACSIYASRPFACRAHLSLDVNDRLCKLLPDITVPVPLADVRQLQSAYVQAGAGEEMADIRDYFPPAR